MSSRMVSLFLSCKGDVNVQDDVRLINSITYDFAVGTISICTVIYYNTGLDSSVLSHACYHV